MSQEQPWTIKRLLEWTTDFLKSKGSSSPQLDAGLLLGYALGTSRIQLYTRYDEVVDEAARTKFRELVKHRSQGVPVAYLMGVGQFYSLDFKVNSDVLIPRPETEHLVVETLDRARLYPARQTVRLLDLGTGSGIIAITLATQLPSLEAVATDISLAALAVAQQNAETHKVTERITFVEGNLFAPIDQLPEDQRRFDFVVSNPPYIAEEERSMMDDDVLKHEPHQALFAADQGTAILRQILDQAAAYLEPQGWLLLELSPMIAQRVKAHAEGTGHYESISLVKDLARHDRVLVARKKL